MMRLLFSVLMLAVVLTLPAPPTAAALSPFRLSQTDQADIARVERYLNGLKTMKARFRQQGQRGDQARGTLYLSRPGKMRLEYDAPINDFIVSDGWFIFHWDSELKQQSQQPLGNNLANVILRDSLKLSGDITVTDVERRAGTLEITLVESEDPGNGQITLIFDDNPLRLARWRVLDAQGLSTNVTLDNIETGIRLENRLFTFNNPITGTP